MLTLHIRPSIHDRTCAHAFAFTCTARASRQTYALHIGVRTSISTSVRALCAHVRTYLFPHVLAFKCACARPCVRAYVRLFAAMTCCAIHVGIVAAGSLLTALPYVRTCVGTYVRTHVCECARAVATWYVRARRNVHVVARSAQSRISHAHTCDCERGVTYRCARARAEAYTQIHSNFTPNRVST